MGLPEMIKMECDCKKEAVAIGGHHAWLSWWVCEAGRTFPVGRFITTSSHATRDSPPTRHRELSDILPSLVLHRHSFR